MLYSDDLKYTRALYTRFKQKLQPNKVLILIGARRVGKTQLIGSYLKELHPNEYLLFNGEDEQTVDVFAERTVNNYKRILGDIKLLVIDEAQKIPEIGIKLKLIVDSIPGIKVIATGSSMFDLGYKLGEPLVGRENTLHLYPLSQLEYNQHENYIETQSKLEERLLFGSYPELSQYTSDSDKIDYLEGLVNTYLLRDILEYNGIRKSDKLMNLLKLVALQIGKELNVNEIANALKGISRNTVEEYLELLSKVFIIYKVPGFNRNLRKEVTKQNRWYFYDNGIRNAIIKNFNPINFRVDKGDLWENYLMSERIKHNAYAQRNVAQYFWRTYDQQEIDLIEEGNGKLQAFEFKWMQKKVKAPGGWRRAYPEASFEVVDTKNYLDFILPPLD